VVDTEELPARGAGSPRESQSRGTRIHDAIV
jgi:hypothetical protein